MESCRLARRNLLAHHERQTKLRSLYSSRPENIFKQGDRVLLRTKKHNFHKYSPISYPTFTKSVFTISEVHNTVYPVVYSLKESGDKRRRYYGFELFKLDHAYDNIRQTKETSSKNRIFVEDVRLERPSKLRSGKIVPGKEKPVYTVWQNGKKDTVGAGSLDLWKSVLGDDVLVYSPNFKDPHKATYQI